MKLSMMTYSMWRQKEHYDFRQMLALTRELGIEGIDYVTLQGMDAAEVRRINDEYGIAIAAHTFFADLNHADAADRRPGLEAARQGIADALTLGAPVVMIPTGGKDGVPREVSRRQWIEGLKEVRPMAEEAGVTLTVENFPGANSPFVIADDLLEAVEAVPGLRITYDNGNAASGEDPVESFRRVAPYVVHAHFKDWVTRETPAEGFRPMLDGRYYRAALIGEGEVPHADCLRAMHEAGYDGYINIEYEGNAYRPDEAMRKAVATLRANIREAAALTAPRR